MERIDPAITEYLTRKRRKRQSKISEDTTTDASEEGSKKEATRSGKKRKGKLEKGQGDKLLMKK